VRARADCDEERDGRRGAALCWAVSRGLMTGQVRE
jgi:hypothetical protein